MLFQKIRSVFRSPIRPALCVAVLLNCLLGVCSDSVATADDHTIEESFLNGQLNRMQFGVVGDRSLMSPEPEGLQIVAATPTNQNVGLAIPEQVRGDFEFTLDVVLNDITKPADGYGTGAALLMEDGDRFGASLQLVVLPSGEKNVVAHHYEIVAGEHQHQAKTFPAVTGHGTLKMQRDGSELTYSISTDGGTSFKELQTIDFTDTPIRVTQAYAQAGGAENLFDVTFRSLKLTADELIRRGQRPESGSGFQLAAVATIGVLGLIGTVVIGIVILRNRKAAAESGS